MIINAKRIYSELESNAAVFSSLLSGITQEEALLKPDLDSWSILEVLGHLLDEERLDFRKRLDITLFHQGEKWPPIDPQEWVLAEKYNQRSLV